LVLEGRSALSTAHGGAFCHDSPFGMQIAPIAAEGQKNNQEIGEEMNVAEGSAFHHFVKIFSNLHSVIPLGVMGILIATVPHSPTLATDLLVVLSLMLSIIVTLVSMHLLQSRSVFPSLLLVPASPRNAAPEGRTSIAVRNERPREGSNL